MDKIKELEAQIALEVAKLQEGKSNKGDKDGAAAPTTGLQSTAGTGGTSSEDNELLANMEAVLTENGKYFYQTHNGQMRHFVTATGELYVPVPAPVVPVKPVEILDNVAQEPVSKPFNGPSLSTSDLNRWEQIQLERIKNGTYTEKYKSSNNR